MKLWAGRFEKPTDALVDSYNASIGFDYHLAIYDIQGSLAQVGMLRKCHLITQSEADNIRQGLLKILERVKSGEVQFKVQDEDIHMNIERLLHQEIGDDAGKLHTGRSRNDQVALDMHLYLRHQVVSIVEYLYQFLKTLHTLANAHLDTIMPGYTHLQRAEPIRFAHHLLAYFQMFSRDAARLCESFDRINVCPLGAGALAGSGVAIDPTEVAQQLKFNAVYLNSLDAVSDRDFLVEFLANASLIMMHFSKLSEEIILWCSTEFSFIELDDAFCTGSSMMPQKKNPDICELARGKTGRVYGSLMGLLTMLKGLPLAYNKDLQEDKEHVFDVVKTVTTTLQVFTPMLTTMRVLSHTMRAATEQDYSNATNLANYLVQKGLAFRVAHEMTGKIVMAALSQNVLLKDMTLEKLKAHCALVEEDVYEFLEIEAVVEAHQVALGTGKASVVQQLKKSESLLIELSQWIETHQYCAIDD